MSYPPQPPSGPPWPGSPPPSGPPSGPPGWPPQGPPPGPPGFPPYGGPPRRGVGLVVALVVLAVALASALGVGAFFLVSSAGDDDDRRAGGDPTAGATSSATSDGPTTASAPTGPADPTTTTASAPPVTPTDDPGDPGDTGATGDGVTGDVKASDFPGDWDFKLGDVEHTAKLQESFDYKDCAPVEKDSVLTRQGCDHAAQWIYTSLGGKARITHIFLVFDTPRRAKAAQKKLTDGDFDLRAGSTHAAFVQGKWNSSVYGNLVGVTIGTTDTKVPEKRLASVVNYMNTDYRLALLFKL